MRSYLSPASVWISLCLLAVPVASRAGTNLVFNGSQGAGPNWNQPIWKTNNGTAGGTGTAQSPIAGNTYTVNSNATLFGNNTGNARIRNPTTNTGNTITFAGDSLKLSTNADIRFKNITAPTGVTPLICNFPGVGGNPGLILSGGVLNPGDDGNFFMAGTIQVANQSYLCGGDNGAGTTLRPNRRFNISGVLSGSGTMYLFEFCTNFPNAISNANNTFNGQWIVKNGWLQGAALNALGTNSITCDPKTPFPPFFNANATDISTNTSANILAIVEANYLLNSAGVLTLTNGGMMRLHGEACFTDVVIEGTHLSPGIHYFPDLFATYPSNFDAGGLDANGSGAIVVQAFGVPPPLPPTIQKQPLGASAYTNGIARFTVTASDSGFPPLTFQWRTNGVNLVNGGNVSGATSSMLVISNASPPYDSVGYDVVVANASFPATSSVVALTLVATNGEAYETAVQAAGPIAFYEFQETGDPSTNNSPVYDLLGGYFGTYATAAQNGTAGVAGPQASDGLPGFGAGNTAAHFTLDTPNSRVSVMPWNLNTNNVTITAWVYPDTGQNGNEGLVFCRGGATVAGLCYASPVLGGNSLGYNWNNEPDTFNWNSGLTPSPGQWSLLALVVTPTNATVYVLSTNTAGQLTLAASQHVYNHVSLQFDGTTMIGDDPRDVSGTNTFNGKIDDVGVFKRALSQSDLMILFSAASGVSTFAPQIVVQPVSLPAPPQTAFFDTEEADFTGLAVGSAPLTYQWQGGDGVTFTNMTDGGQISGSTTPVLTISRAGVQNAAQYIVIASNPYGMTTSSPATLTITATNAFAINVTMTNNEPSGNDWDIGATSPGANTNWSDLNPASYSAAQSPGNTYELLPGSRLRSPVGPVIANFPGRQLTVDGDGIWRVNPGTADPTSEVRFKQSTYGVVNGVPNGNVNGVVNFRKLRMNGGQLDAGADAGNNNNMVLIGGEIDILANTSFNGDGANDRGFRVDAFLTGASGIEYHAYNPPAFQSNYFNNLNIAGNTNTFSGTWTVVAGTLLGTGANALGTNHIFVGTNGAFETTYDMVSTNAYLVLAPGAKMYLHQTDRFRSAVVSGVSLPTGSNGWAALNASFPSNFPAVWNPQTGATNFSVPSGAIFISASASPLITAQPHSVTNRGQQTASFTIAAVGGLPLSYQWRAGVTNSGVFTNLSNAGNISGATNATLTITNLSFANSGDYTVVITNAFGAVTSSVVTLTELPLPFITLQPLSQTNSGLGTAQFIVSALGDLPLAYQWQAAAIGSGGPYTNINNNSQVSGATSNNMTIINLAITNSADYIVVVSNGFGSATSTPPATLIVNDPFISQQPLPAGTLTLYQQSTAQWTVGALGTPPLAYQWQGGPTGGPFTNLINGARISGANSLVVNIANVDFGDAGDYQFIVSNTGGSATSSVVSLTVLASLPAQAYTLDYPGATPQAQPQGSDWNTLLNWNPDGDAASNSAPARPGSTYTVVPTARLRSPTNVNNVFPGFFTPGIQLIVAGDGVWTNNFSTNQGTVGELRFKHTGGPGTNMFKKLIMNGGQLDAGDNNLVVIQGEMDILANSIIYVDSAAANDRGYRIESWLTGNGGIEWHDFDSTFGAAGGLNIAGASNTFSGTWHVVQGALLGGAANSLGTNSITVDNGGALETVYDLNNPTANLVLNGQMFLHRNDTVRTLTVGGSPVPPGLYAYAQLAGSYATNFPASWTLQTGSAVSTASGSITVLAGPPINPIAMSVTTSQGTNLVFSGTNGIPNGHYKVQSATNLAIPITWAPVASYPFDGSGNFTFTNGINQNAPKQFFRLIQQVP